MAQFELNHTVLVPVVVIGSGFIVSPNLTKVLVVLLLGWEK